MYPWDVLQIEPTEDKKAIKKAYAMLLRKHRPDTDPKGFQEINEAYQFALEMHGVSTEILEPITEIRSDDQPKDQVNEDSEKQVSFQWDDYQDLIQGMFDQIELMVNAKSQTRRKLENWQFLDVYHDILDLRVKQEVSNEVFEKVAKINHTQMMKEGVLLIERPVLKLMNEVFSWDQNWLHLSQLFPQHYFYYALEHASLDNELKDEMGEFTLRRFLAFKVDVVIGLVVSYFLFNDQYNDSPEYEFYRYLLVVSLFLLIGEFSEFRTTAGKFLFKIKLVDLQNQPLQNKQVLLRTILFHGSFLFFYMYVNGVQILDSSVASGSLLLAGISVLVFLISGSPLHDQWSRVRIGRL